MKFVTMIALTLAVTQAHAAQSKAFPVLTTIDFSQSQGELSQNMMDDGIEIPEGFDTISFGLQFTVPAGQSFQISSDATDGDDGSVTCNHAPAAITSLANGEQKVTVEVDPEVGTDDGSSCDYTVRLSSGKSATVNFFSQGT